MKKISLLILLLSVSLNLLGEDKFYYSGKKQIPLREVKGKNVVIVPMIDSQISKISSMAEEHRLQDERLMVNVISEFSRTSLKTVENLSAPLHIEQCYTDPQGLELIPTGYINLQLKNVADFELLEKRAAEFGLQITESSLFMPLWYELVLTFENDESIIDIANRLSESGEFASCSPAFSYDGREITYDPFTSQQWSLYNSEYEGIDINIVPAWDYATGNGVKIAIVDGGVDLTHQDLSGNASLSYDCENNTSPNIIYDDHATLCGGIAAAVRNNNVGIAGVAPDAKIISVRVNFNSCTVTKQIAEGIDWARKNGADIISCSWTSPECDLISQAIETAITQGRGGKGCIIVKSAGNDNGPITYPGSLRKEVLAVASLMKNGNRMDNSCYGESMFISAPGKDIISTFVGNKFGTGSGTSMACPHVSGVAALVIQRNPMLTALQVREVLAKSTTQVGDKPYSTNKEYGEWNQWYGYGLIDAYKAVINTPRK